jgi:hypothetical protein
MNFCVYRKSKKQYLKVKKQGGEGKPEANPNKTNKTKINCFVNIKEKKISR